MSEREEREREKKGEGVKGKFRKPFFATRHLLDRTIENAMLCS